MTIITSEEISTIVDEICTMIRSDEDAEPAARALGVMAVTLVGTIAADLHRAADALVTMAGNSAELDRYKKFYGPLA